MTMIHVHITDGICTSAYSITQPNFEAAYDYCGTLFHVYRNKTFLNPVTIKIEIEEGAQGMNPDNYRYIYLTDEEMAQLDDGQQWYEPGDTVTLSCHSVPATDDNPDAIPLSLSVNDTDEHDNWTFWDELPDNIKERMREGYTK